MNSVRSHDTVSCIQPAACWKAADVFGPERTQEEVLSALRSDPESFREFQMLTPELKSELLDFAMGVRGAKVTYDPVFKKVFHPEQSPERLEDFLSLCLGEKLKILHVLPGESSRLAEEGSLLVLDILVRLESGALVNVEIQRIGYLFPGQRCACYSSDLVMRQYSQVRSEKRKRRERFSYQDIQKVYTIILLQKSPEEFHQFPDQYLHYAKQTFNTGLELNLVQEYLIIPLDIFLKSRHNKDIETKLEGWLYFIASDRMADIRRVLNAYPEFAELYREVFEFRWRTEELISMFSKELRILDANTAQYMIEIQQEKIELQQKTIETQKRQLEQLEELKRENERLKKQMKRSE